ncbi:MAG TPA: phospholipase D-like domain-containing protein [Polyangiaceae bacterium]|nr:phospholipase D-like domain-containing protein [Polyangiaceae bacterium]
MSSETAKPDRVHWVRRVFSRRSAQQEQPSFGSSSELEQIRLLDGGDQAYPRMLEAIVQAQHQIYLEVYSFAITGIGRDFVAALAAAAGRGVEVTVVMDGWGSVLSGRAVAAELRAAGCTVQIYHRLLALLKGRFGRTHRKLLLVDECVAFIGGINIGDENVQRGLRPGWADLALEIRGIHRLRLSQLLRGRPVRSVCGNLSIDISGLGGGWRMRRRYVTAFSRAEKRILLAHGYFLPDRRTIRSIIAAARRGVEVGLVLAGHSDVPLVRAATRRLYRRLLAAGVHIYEWSGSVLHAKVAAVDGHCLLIGSFNLDPFSLANREVLVRVNEPSLVSEGEQWIQNKLSKSTAISALQLESPLHKWIWDPIGALVAALVEFISRLLAGRRRHKRRLRPAIEPSTAPAQKH